MKAMIRIAQEYFGKMRGSTSEMLSINRAQFCSESLVGQFHFKD